MKPPAAPSSRHRFPAGIISHAVWLYHVFGLNLREVELLLAERGVVVSYETIRRWCQKFAACFADRMCRRRPQPGDKWHMDEVFIRIRGVQHYLWRAVEQNGVVLDILVQARRDAARDAIEWRQTAIGPAVPTHSRFGSRRRVPNWRHNRIMLPCPRSKATITG